MHYTKNILLILAFCLSTLVDANSQASSNSGTILNLGTINFNNGGMTNETVGVIKNTLGSRININDQTLMQSTGQIENEGTIYALGYLNFNQKSINGEVIYENKGSGNNKPIENASYFSVKFLGNGKKILNRDENIEARNMFYSDGSSIITWPEGRNNISFIIKDSMNHNGMINPDFTGSKFMLEQSIDRAQKLMGTGNANILELNNTFGADIYDTTAGNTNKDGLKINHLILTNGELRNSPSANITIGGSSLLGSSTTLSFATGTITRTALGSIKSEPNMPTKVDLFYIGGSTEPLIASGNEIPQIQTDKINDLNVMNDNGVKLSNSATVNNKLTVKSALYTYQRDADTVINEKELVINSQVDPEYLQDTSEVHGRMTRINFDPTKTLLFNNKYTSLRFFDAAANTGNLKRLSMNIKPNIAYDDLIRKGIFRVQRQLEISADTIAEGINRKDLALASGILETRFGWRYDAGSNALTNEVSSALELKKDKLTFQYWNGIAWKDNKTSSLLPISGNWQQTTADLGFNGSFGEFGVGAPAQTTLEIMAKVILEGPYKYGSLANDAMYTDLRDSNMIPLTPPAIYPYILDTNRALHFVTSIPKNVVDWVVVEFRDKAINADRRFFRTCFLRKDGRLVDLDGISDVSISQQFTQDTNRNPIDTSGKTQYYVAIRHRNHITLMSQNTLQFTLEGQSALFDFTSPSFVWGGNQSIKHVGFDLNKKKVYAAAAGNFSDPNNNKLRSNYFTGLNLFGVDNGMDMITDFDKSAVWDFMTSGSYTQGYLTEDYNLDGIITTKDFNISWNNRTRLGSIK